MVDHPVVADLPRERIKFSDERRRATDTGGSAWFAQLIHAELGTPGNLSTLKRRRASLNS
jgi:hypothetical protein